MKNLFLLNLLLAGLAHAKSLPEREPKESNGNVLGNGGKVVICRDEAEQIKSIELTEFYLTRVYKSTYPSSLPKEDIAAYDIAPFPPGDALEKAKGLISRLKTLDPLREQIYQAAADDFFSHVEFTDELPLTGDGRLNIDLLPPHCTIAQAAIQVFGETTIKIVKSLWEAMDENQRAGLILHEVTYRMALLQGHRHVIRVHDLTAFIASNQLLKMTVESYRKVLSSLDLFYFETQEAGRSWIFADFLGFAKEGYGDIALLASRVEAARACQTLFQAQLIRPEDILNLPLSFRRYLAQALAPFTKDGLILPSEEPDFAIQLGRDNLFLLQYKASALDPNSAKEYDIQTIKLGILCVKEISH